MKQFTPNDKFFYKAKEAWYRARSAFKLLEIQEKFNFLKKDQIVLDLWAFPWSWLQVVKSIQQGQWRLIWVDLKEIKKIKWVKTYIWDIFSKDFTSILRNEDLKCFDVILSDMAPNTSWVPDVDQYKSVEINLKALELMKSYLKTWGWGVFKVFKWEDFNDFWDEAKKLFPNIKTFKPNTTRDRSVEVFCIWKKF